MIRLTPDATKKGELDAALPPEMPLCAATERGTVTVMRFLHQLGVLKALGFTNEQVLRLVLAESGLLSLLGGLLGLGLAWGLIARGDPTGGALPIFFFPPRDLWLGLGLILALGFAAGIFPALKAMRLNIAEALRRM